MLSPPADDFCVKLSCGQFLPSATFSLPLPSREDGFCRATLPAEGLCDMRAVTCGGTILQASTVSGALDN